MLKVWSEVAELRSLKVPAALVEEARLVVVVSEVDYRILRRDRVDCNNLQAWDKLIEDKQRLLLLQLYNSKTLIPAKVPK